MTTTMKKRFRKILLASTLALFGATGCDEMPRTTGAPGVPPRSSVPSATTVYALEGDAAQCSARAFLVGTWTYTGTDTGGLWLKWIIKDTGEIEYYAAAPSDDNWGTPLIHHWSVMTDKYTNTGKRYYGMRFNDVTIDANKDSIKKLPPQIAMFMLQRTIISLLRPERCIISPGFLNDTIEYHLGETTISMDRGDKFPFSK